MRNRAESLGFDVTLSNDHQLDMSSEKLKDHAHGIFEDLKQHVKNCDAIIAGLNDFRGYECGMAFELGKKLYGRMDDTRPMKDRVPNLGPGKEYRDMAGINVENFDYPLNLMFACSMKIWEGSFKEVVERAAKDLMEGKTENSGHLIF